LVFETAAELNKKGTGDSYVQSIRRMHHNVVCCRPALMGAQPGTYAQELVKPGKIPAVPAIGDADQPLHVLRRRPDIIAAERRLAPSNERIGMAIADY
jgi:hypothetical protein